MRRFSAIALAAVFACYAGCYAPPTLPTDQGLPVKAAEHAFRVIGKEPGSALAGFIVYWAKDEAEYRRLCVGTTVDLSAACSSQHTTLAGKPYPRAVLRPGQPVYDQDGCSVVAHEAIHWLINRLRLNPNSQWDMGSHGDKRFFGRSVPGSAEQIACSWLREQRGPPHRPTLPNLSLSRLPLRQRSVLRRGG